MTAEEFERLWRSADEAAALMWQDAQETRVGRFMGALIRLGILVRVWARMRAYACRRYPTPGAVHRPPGVTLSRAGATGVSSSSPAALPGRKGVPLAVPKHRDRDPR